MGALAIAIPYVLFVWWFSTGTVLLLVGMSLRHDVLLKVGAAVLFVASLVGLAASSREASAAGAYCVFTCAILLWGAVEISLLAGWITGPRPQACPRDCTTVDRVWFALQATAYHEFALIATAGLAFAVTVGAPNQLGWWTFGAMLVLRQSAKINLFLGVRTLNDELLPSQVDFLRSYFARKPINALFPFSVTLATAAAAWLAVAAVGAESRFDALSYSLLAALVALGALEHWFMVLPMPVVDLWRWSVRAQAPMAPTPEPIVRPVLAVIPGGAAAAERPAVKSAAFLARQRLEDQFRQSYRDSKAASALGQDVS
ncbi:putative photosynthetic complex assembly protein PuhE [Bradyrhizobium sp.]|uniref:putative photosynthetic complex assembly protein PuhE n=1 Tax=Bradyrhizobium sp. TaxID=376 RepID=UPI0039E5628E